MNQVFFALTLVFSCVCLAAVQAGESRNAFSATITKEVGAHYLVVTPDGYDPQQKWPLLIFLHGRGESGDNLDLVKVHGPYKMVADQKLPFIIVAPQSPADEWWDTDMLSALVDRVLEELPVDRERVYLTGLSMGGYGTWDLAVKRPEVFAAIAPICGVGKASQAARLKEVPVWAFHGGKDPVVPMSGSADMVRALYELGCDARLTIYPEAGHDSWTETYNNPELYKWLLSKRKAAK